MRRLLLACLTLAPFLALAEPGVREVSPPVPTGGDRLEVAEFFWYGCGHCYALEPQVVAWKAKLPADVAFRRVPAMGSASQVEVARLYYALEAMGQIDKLHAKIFDAMHKDKRNLANAKVREVWLQEHGVAVAAYNEMAKSFTVATKLDRAKQLMIAYRLDAVPRFVVQGRYVVAPEEVGLPALFPTLERLIATTRGRT